MEKKKIRKATAAWVVPLLSESFNATTANSTPSTGSRRSRRHECIIKGDDDAEESELESKSKSSDDESNSDDDESIDMFSVVKETVLLQQANANANANAEAEAAVDEAPDAEEVMEKNEIETKNNDDEEEEDEEEGKEVEYVSRKSTATINEEAFSSSSEDETSSSSSTSMIGLQPPFPPQPQPQPHYSSHPQQRSRAIGGSRHQRRKSSPPTITYSHSDNSLLEEEDDEDEASHSSHSNSILEKKKKKMEKGEEEQESSSSSIAAALQPPSPSPPPQSTTTVLLPPRLPIVSSSVSEWDKALLSGKPSTGHVATGALLAADGPSAAAAIKTSSLSSLTAMTTTSTATIAAAAAAAASEMTTDPATNQSAPPASAASSTAASLPSLLPAAADASSSSSSSSSSAHICGNTTTTTTTTTTAATTSASITAAAVETSSGAAGAESSTEPTTSTIAAASSSVPSLSSSSSLSLPPSLAPATVATTLSTATTTTTTATAAAVTAASLPRRTSRALQRDTTTDPDSSALLHKKNPRRISHSTPPPPTSHSMMKTTTTTTTAAACTTTHRSTPTQTASTSTTTPNTATATSTTAAATATTTSSTTSTTATTEDNHHSRISSAGVLPDVLKTMRMGMESLQLFDSDILKQLATTATTTTPTATTPIEPIGNNKKLNKNTINHQGVNHGNDDDGVDNDDVDDDRIIMMDDDVYDDDDQESLLLMMDHAQYRESLKRASQQSISAAVLVSLAHKRYERRRLAAMEMEKICRSLLLMHPPPPPATGGGGVSSTAATTTTNTTTTTATTTTHHPHSHAHPQPHPQNVERIRAILLLLSEDYVRSTNEDARKGGVVALAACAIAMKRASTTTTTVTTTTVTTTTPNASTSSSSNTSTALPPPAAAAAAGGRSASSSTGVGATIAECRDLIFASVLHACQDHSSRVRYYATESLFNVVKVIPTMAVQHFFILFEILRSLYADVDAEVRTGAELLDRKLKEIIVDAINQGTGGTFTAEACLPVFCRFVYMRSKPTKQLTLSWLQVLHDQLTVPDPIVEFLHLFLSGIFDMIADPTVSIRESAILFLQSVLPKLLRVDAIETTTACTSRSSSSTSQSLSSTTSPDATTVTSHATTSGTPRVDFDKILQSLVTTMEHPDPFVRKVAMYWMSRIVKAHCDPESSTQLLANGESMTSTSIVTTTTSSTITGATPSSSSPSMMKMMSAGSMSVRNSLPHILPGILLSIGDDYHPNMKRTTDGHYYGRDSFLPDLTTRSLAEQTNATLQAAVRRDGSSCVPYLDGFIVALREELDISEGGAASSGEVVGTEERYSIGNKPRPRSISRGGGGTESDSNATMAAATTAGLITNRYPPPLERTPYRVDVKQDGTGIESAGWFSSDGEVRRDTSSSVMSRLCALDWVMVLYESVVPVLLKADYAREFVHPIIHQLVDDPPESIVFKSLEVLAKITVPDAGETGQRSTLLNPSWLNEDSASIKDVSDAGAIVSTGSRLFPMTESNISFAYDILEPSRRALISRTREVFSALIDLYAHNTKFLGDLSSVITYMCRLQPPEFVFVSFAIELEAFLNRSQTPPTLHTTSCTTVAHDLKYVSSFVQNLNHVLLNQPEAKPMRDCLRDCVRASQPLSEHDRQRARLFHILLHAFAHNLAATTCLCFWAGAYRTVNLFLNRIDPLDIHLMFLLEIDRFVELLERPLFRHLHVRMLEHDTDPQFEGSGSMLFTALKSLLLLLPQSVCYHVLKDRLVGVSRFRQSTLSLSSSASTNASISKTTLPTPPTPLTMTRAMTTTIPAWSNPNLQLSSVSSSNPTNNDNNAAASSSSSVFLSRVLEVRSLHCEAAWNAIRSESLEVVSMEQVSVIKTEEPAKQASSTYKLHHFPHSTKILRSNSSSSSSKHGSTRPLPSRGNGADGGDGSDQSASATPSSGGNNNINNNNNSSSDVSAILHHRHYRHRGTTDHRTAAIASSSTTTAASTTTNANANTTNASSTTAGEGNDGGDSQPHEAWKQYWVTL